MKKFLARFVLVAVVAVFPAICLGVGLPGVIGAIQPMLGVNQQPQVIDLSGPRVIRTCPSGMELKTLTDTRQNFNRTGTVTNVSYECVGPNDITAKPTETTEFTSNQMPSLGDQNFFFSPVADWLRVLAYPVSFIIIFGASFLRRSGPPR